MTESVTPPRILIIDANETSAAETRERVEGFGYSVIASTSNWKKALQVVTNEHPDLALIEIEIENEMIGIEVVQRIYARHRIPIIIYTAIADELVIEESKSAGAIGYLTKPCSDRGLYTTIEFALFNYTRIEGFLEKEERYALSLLGGKDGLWDWNLKTNEIYFSPRWKRMLGYEESEINSPNEWFDLVHSDDSRNLKSVLDSHLKGFSEHFEMEYRIRKKNDSYAWVSCRGYALRDKDLKPYRIAGLQTDISKYREDQERLIQSALYDLLTGLPSRALFMDHLERVIKISKRYAERKFTIFCLETDQYKLIQDMLGEDIADKFVLEISSRLKSMLRPGDILARIEDDNFMILIEDIQDINYSIRIAERIKKVLSLPFTLEENEINCKVSIGIVIHTPEYNQPDECIRDVMEALQQARDLGKDRFEIFGKAKHSQIMANIKLEAELRKALENNELTIYYQPIISVKNFSVTSFEAFVRWYHPQLGFVPAGEFIKIAEESGLLILMGNWIMENACQQIKELHDLGFADLSVAVNLSPLQFRQKNMVHEIQKVLKKSKLEPQYLRLELPEQLVMENAETNVELLKELKNIGLQLTMDDFGTGYSSLSYLKRFPFNHLKIDLSIIRDIPFSEEAVAVANAIIFLAHNLNMKVVAEGVEKKEQMKFLQAQGCDEFQGAIFSMPVDPEDIQNVLNEDFSQTFKRYFTPKK